MKTACACAVFVLAVSSSAAAQGATGAGKVEIGLYPVGATFLVGGDDNKEVNFNVYTAGTNLTYYATRRIAIEGELTIGFGLAQDVFFNKAEVLHVQMPNVWSYSGNVVFFPGGTADTRLPLYVTGGVGAVSLQSRTPTGQFGYDVDTVGFETFVAENIGGGLKIFRDADAPDWGFRIDYRYLIVNANSDAPAFFAKAKTRGGHRLAFGILFTWKR
jgi:opacity protein-like surface antigen